MRFLILELRRDPEHDLFTSLGAPLGLDVQSFDPRLLQYDGSAGVQLAGQRPELVFDALVVRSYRYFALTRELARQFMSRQRPVLGCDPLHSAFCQDKLADLIDLSRLGVPVPQTWANTKDCPHSTFVVKDNWGYGGAGVRLATSAESVEDCQANTHVQEFLPAEQDWRVLLCQGKALPWIIVRTPAAGDFRTNTHQGGLPQVVPAAQFIGARQLQSIAEAAGCALGRDNAGVDLRAGPSGPLVLEVNRTPRLRLGEHSTSVIQAYLTAWREAVRHRLPK